MQGGEDKDGGLAHTGLGLADDVEAEHCLRDALVLHLGRVFKAAVDDGAEKLGLEHKIAKVARVDADIVAPAMRCDAICAANCGVRWWGLKMEKKIRTKKSAEERGEILRWWTWRLDANRFLLSSSWHAGVLWGWLVLNQLV